MKKLFLAASLMLSALFSSAKLVENTDIEDLALIYIGAEHRPNWDKELFEPYVVHTYADGTKSWMFDAFLMIEFMNWNENNIAVSFGEYNGAAAQRKDWEKLLDNQLGLNDGLGCRALDELIGEYIPVLGAPGHKHKVVFSLPLPIGADATWGRIGNLALNFAYYDHRVRAMQWYVDRLILFWNNANFKNIELDGVYWTKEAFSASDGQLARDVNQYCHEKGLKTYWIPYFAAQGRDKWKEWGMDAAFIQPNYYFRLETPKSQLYQATDAAWENEMFLEMEFEGYNYDRNKNPYAPENIGLYGYSEQSPLFYQRLVDYINRFENEAIFDFMPIAYYSGFSAVYDFVNSGHPKDAEIMHRLARLMNKRHVENGWDVGPQSGITEIESDTRILVEGMNGAIYIANEAGDDVAVYDIAGHLIYNRASSVATESHNYGITIPCARGLYIVRCGGKSVKVNVR